uniref:Swi5-dependent recombination DNA repair protein 1 homolog n=2 Tax=Sarcophilus harrisii TaxID=9305 RepID=A0A7N4NHR3_SARHA
MRKLRPTGAKGLVQGHAVRKRGRPYRNSDLPAVRPGTRSSAPPAPLPPPKQLRSNLGNLRSYFPWGSGGGGRPQWGGGGTRRRGTPRGEALFEKKNKRSIFEMDIPSEGAPPFPVPPPAGEAVTGPPPQRAGKRPMSTTLRERLKKTRSSFHSCHTVTKRLKVGAENNSATLKEATSSSGENCSGSPESCKNIEKAAEENLSLKDGLMDVDIYRDKSLVKSTLPDNLSQVVSEGYNIGKQELLEEKMKLLKQVQEKEELLQRLKLTKMYRSKNNLSQLQSLIKKWRNSSQLLLFELQSTLSMENKKLSLTQLIDSYGLEDQLLHYNRIEEEFTDF